MNHVDDVYTVGYGIGKVTTLWAISRKLSAIGCKDETLAELLSLPRCCVRAAHGLDGAHDEEATAVLLDAIRCIVSDSYREYINPEDIKAIADQECRLAKSLITQPAEIWPS